MPRKSSKDMASSISPEEEEVSIALVSQIECERQVHTRENVEGLWEVVQMACMNEKMRPPPTGHRGRRNLVGSLIFEFSC